MNKISERLYCLEYDTYADRPNLYYIKGDIFSVAIDAGNSKNHNDEFYAELRRNDLPLPKYTIVSHWHWDHCFGLHNIVGTSISSRKTHDKLKEVCTWKWTIEDMKERLDKHIDIQFCYDNILREYMNLNDIKVVTTDNIIDNNTIIDLGGISIELIPHSSTHGDDSLFVYIPSEKALIVEDGDCPDYYINDDYSDVDKLEEMINFFESIDYEYHYLGHAPRESKQFALDRLKEELSRIKG